VSRRSTSIADGPQHSPRPPDLYAHTWPYAVSRQEARVADTSCGLGLALSRAVSLHRMAAWTRRSGRSATSTRLVLDGIGKRWAHSWPTRWATTRPGEEDHSGDFCGCDQVVALLQKLVDITEGIFDLEPEGHFLNLDQYSAVAVRWWADRDGQRSDGHELAVYRIHDGRIAEVWFYNEPSDADAFSRVFAFE
jgi:hypothetical protein